MLTRNDVGDILFLSTHLSYFGSILLIRVRISFNDADEKSNHFMTWDATGLERRAEPDNPESPEEYSYLQSDVVKVKGKVSYSKAYMKV